MVGQFFLATYKRQFTLWIDTSKIIFKNNYISSFADEKISSIEYPT